MVDQLLTTIKKILPKKVFNFLQPLYHWLLSFVAPVIFGFPSNKLIVIGVTGTKGKSTTCYLLARILETAGYKIGMSSGIIFKLAEREWLNDYKMTMPGRLQQQKLLRAMVKAGCQYAIIETTSEGIKQFRHASINYDVVVFTNLFPEHIESHGSFAKYREAKGKLFYHLTQKPRKKFYNKKVTLVNLDDKNSDYFTFFPADEKYGFSLQADETRLTKADFKIFKASQISYKSTGTKFRAGNLQIETKLLGEMNLYNSLAAISIAKVFGISDKPIQQALLSVASVPGRVEFIDEGQSFKVIVDYAHDPESLRQLFATINQLKVNQAGARIIHIFGATGGGRDQAKRSVMGQVSDQNADVIVLTNDDPYQENYQEIIEQISNGIGETKKILKIADRREAITKALNLAQAGDLVVITGKGSEQAIMLNDGKHAWDDRQVVRSLLHE